MKNKSAGIRYKKAREIRRSVVLRCLELMPANLHGGFTTAEAISNFTGIPKRTLRPILRDLERTRDINGYHGAIRSDMRFFEAYRAKNRMFG
jgi:hypothetical protein